MASAGLAARVLTGTTTAGTTTARSYRARPYRKTQAPTARQRHLLNRMGCGFSVASFKQLRKAGGATTWFERQLDPDSVPESKRAKAVDQWFPTLQHDPVQIWNNDRNDVHASWEYARDLSNYSLLRRIYSNRTVHENLVEFWSNHFHVESQHFPAFTQRPAYDATIRRHALGTFEELLVAVTLHPAMLMFLDNWKSVKNAPNENHGRELLELHTVGAAAGYTEQMVKDSAKILSGHTVKQNEWHGFFDPNRHTTGAVSVLGFSHPNSTADNPGLATDYLRHLARHPATARRIARKLAIRFVADDPSEALVETVAAAYLSSGTDIKATLRALVNSDEFWRSAGTKVRTPIDDVVATCRALQVQAKAPADDSSFVHELSWTLSSTLCFQWPRPDGPPDRGATWASTTRMLNSWQMHTNFAGGWWPDGQVKYKAPASYLPQKRIPFDKFVDHLSRTVLGRPATAQLLQAACEGCDVPPRQVITKSHAVVSWKFVRLLAVLLDSPAHMTR